SLLEKQADAGCQDVENVSLKPGDDVKLLNYNQRGSILEVLNNDEFIVQVGIMKVNVQRKDLQLIDEPKASEQTTIPTIRTKTQHVTTELDLRGERYEDALNRLEKYIDNVLIAGYSNVSIIHGKGTGALRKGVRQFAESHPNIATFRDGKAKEGGTGVTMIELR